MDRKHPSPPPPPHHDNHGGKEVSTYLEPPKVSAKLSFYSEEHSNKLATVPNATTAQQAAARRVVFKEPDADLLASIVFGDDE